MRAADRRAAAVLVVVAVAAVLGCSDGEVVSKTVGERTTLPSAVLLEADELAQAVLVAKVELPDRDWDAFEFGMEDLRKLYRPPTETDSTSPPECRSLEPPPYMEPSLHGLVAMQTRTITTVEGGEVFGVSSSVMVFESVTRARRFMDRSDPAADSWWSQPCFDARGPAGREARIEATLYELPEERAFRVTTVPGASSDPMEFAIEIHDFMRGRVIGSYTVLGDAKRPGAIDHQGLLEAFEARVVGAQE